MVKQKQLGGFKQVQNLGPGYQGAGYETGQQHDFAAGAEGSHAPPVEDPR
jgi:hypothetical protein